MSLRVGILGAGSIGTFLGLGLDRAGVDVIMLGRPWLAARHEREPLRATWLNGGSHTGSSRLKIVTELDELVEVDAALLTCKSGDALDLARAWRARTGPEGPPMWTMQNGIEGGRRLRGEGLHRMHDGSVTFNVVMDEDGVHQSTTGRVYLARPSRRGPGEQMAAALAGGGVECLTRAEMGPILRGKLVLNLNNGVCALTGLHIGASVASRDARVCFSMAVREAMRVFDVAGLAVARVGRVPPRLLAPMLRLPDAILHRVAAGFVRIDPRAVSSTLDDLRRGRPTEINALHGAVSALGKTIAHPTPVNDFITSGVLALSESPGPPVFWSPVELRRRLELLASGHGQ